MQNKPAPEPAVDDRLPFTHGNDDLITTGRILQRAEELAEGDGRTAAQATLADYEEAWFEISGTPIPDALLDQASAVFTARDPAEAITRAGRQRLPKRAAEVQEIVEQQYRKGLNQALHEELLEAENKPQ